MSSVRLKEGLTFSWYIVIVYHDMKKTFKFKVGQRVVTKHQEKSGKIIARFRNKVGIIECPCYVVMLDNFVDVSEVYGGMVLNFVFAEWYLNLEKKMTA